MGALSNGDPSYASRPFDKNRDGFVMCEGAAVLALERLDHATDRGATIYGVLVGLGETSDSHHLVSPLPDGSESCRSMLNAIRDAKLTPWDIVSINAHGTSTVSNDLAEARAISSVFAERCPPVTSIKGSIGHMLGAAGALEVAIALLSASRGIVPPTANHTEMDQEIHLDIVSGRSRKVSAGPTISNSFGFGGHNVSIVVRGPS
jgi:3-oxoacyl-[acyl-carrier-protein] synthase II